MGDSFDHFTIGAFIWKVIKTHSIQSMCELINDLSRLSWGAAHPKHLPALHSGDPHSSQVQLSTQELSYSPENGNFRGFYTHAKRTFWARNYLPTASQNKKNSTSLCRPQRVVLNPTALPHGNYTGSNGVSVSNDGSQVPSLFSRHTQVCVQMDLGKPHSAPPFCCSEALRRL